MMLQRGRTAEHLKWKWIRTDRELFLQRLFKARLARLRLRRARVAIWLVLWLAVSALCLHEARTSFLAARFFSAIAADLSYRMEPGPSSTIVFPDAGPFNRARGYTALPDFQHRLRDAGFHIVAQSVFSSKLERFVRWGIHPPQREPAAAGLVIRGTHNTVLYDAASGHRLFTNFEEIPALLTKALLFVENRELDDFSSPTRNPVVDWARSGKAVFSFAGRKIGLPFQIEGGSTLATQI
jgi:hypothetical protein